MKLEYFNNDDADNDSDDIAFANTQTYTKTSRQ